MRDHATVAAGDVLVRLDPEPYRLALAKADAEIDSARASVEQLKVSLRETRADAKETENRLAYLEVQAKRQRELSGRGVSSAARVEQADSEEQQARDRLCDAAAAHRARRGGARRQSGAADRPLRRGAREAGAARPRRARSLLYRDQGAARRHRAQCPAPARRAGEGADAAVLAGRRPAAVGRGEFQGDRPHLCDGRPEGDRRARHASRHHLGGRGRKHQPGDRRRVRDPAAAERVAATG